MMEEYEKPNLADYPKNFDVWLDSALCDDLWSAIAEQGRAAGGSSDEICTPELKAAEQNVERIVGLLIKNVMEAEREACALTAEACDTLGAGYSDNELTAEGHVARQKVKQVAKAIRARQEGSNV